MLLAWGCLHGNSAHAGIDQLWYLSWYESGGVNKANINSMRPPNDCLDLNGALAVNYGGIDMYPCNSQWNQRWNLGISNSWCGSHSTYNGTDYQTPCTNNTWYSLAVGDDPGSYCLDVPGGNDANWTAVQLWGCNGTSAQVWRTGISQYGESPFWIRSNITGSGVNRCLTNTNAAEDGGLPNTIVLYDCAYDF
jgi:hypothetical protein